MMRKLLIIDDAEDLRQSMASLLADAGFEVLEAADGLRGVQLAQTKLPDLILCDIAMPGYDGYQVLETLRHNPRTSSISIIFLTGKGTRLDMRRGIELGADDYLIKPCSVEEILGAVNTRLEKQAALRVRTQQELNNLRSSIIFAFPQELRIPLNRILSETQVLRDYRSDQPTPNLPEIGEAIFSATERLQEILRDFLLYTKLELTAQDPQRIAALRSHITYYPKGLIAGIASRYAKQFDRFADLKLTLENAFVMMADSEFNKVCEELIENAFRYSPKGSPISIQCAIQKQRYWITITDSGQGMSEEQIANLLKYGNGLTACIDLEWKDQKQASLRFGIAISQRLLELHDGTLQIRSQIGQGTTVEASLPIKRGSRV
ncbi:MAG: response regulator [Elainella sp. Prado103]|jgi:CheY-like chemotaxis protein|nr:response regulator [Elainella sp. Prado103]